MKNILLLRLAVAALAVIILWWQNLISPGILAVILVLLAVAGVGTRVCQNERRFKQTASTI